MSIKQVITRQYQDEVNSAARALTQARLPAEGWIRTVRKALSMSAAELARRLGKTGPLVAKTEKSELEGRVTLRTMNSFAEAMGCRFVYAIVPEGDIEDLVSLQAERKARQLVERTNQHMRLEAQGLTDNQLAGEVQRIQQDLLRDMPSDFWKKTI